MSEPQTVFLKFKVRHYRPKDCSALTKNWKCWDYTGRLREVGGRDKKKIAF